jgi:hypothetical protein
MRRRLASRSKVLLDVGELGLIGGEDAAVVGGHEGASRAGSGQFTL